MGLPSSELSLSSRFRTISTSTKHHAPGTKHTRKEYHTARNAHAVLACVLYHLTAVGQRNNNFVH